jgi:hypothetical protein
LEEVMKTKFLLNTGTVLILILVCLGFGQAFAQKPWLDKFDVDLANLSSIGRNPYFILEPGYVLVLEGREGRKKVVLTITVLEQTRKVQNVETRVVEERETVNGELEEVSRNFFAICRLTSRIFYFGEEVDEYRKGKIIGHEGAWLSGEKNAKFGLMMPGSNFLEAKYYQEIAPGVAMDRAEIISVSEIVETSAGRFEQCLKIEETNPLEGNEKEYKYYSHGIGLIQDGSLKLVRYGKK